MYSISFFFLNSKVCQKVPEGLGGPSQCVCVCVCVFSQFSDVILLVVMPNKMPYQLVKRL